MKTEATIYMQNKVLTDKSLLLAALGPSAQKVVNLWARDELQVGHGNYRVDVAAFYTTQDNEMIIGCFEIKSCESDFKSGYGRNFYGHVNYFVVARWMVDFMLAQYDNGKIPPHVGLICICESGNYKIVKYAGTPPLQSRRVHKVYDLGLISIGTPLSMEICRETSNLFSRYRFKYHLIRNQQDMSEIEEYFKARSLGLEPVVGADYIVLQAKRENPIYKDTIKTMSEKYKVSLPGI